MLGCCSHWDQPGTFSGHQHSLLHHPQVLAETLVWDMSQPAARAAQPGKAFCLHRHRQGLGKDRQLVLT